MVSMAKRMKYVSDNEVSSSDDDSCESSEYHNSGGKKNEFRGVEGRRRPTRKPKCFTKNALMARENRLKKKMYIMNLEMEVGNLKTDNKKLSTVVDNQSFLISELKKEVKYLKSVLANSADISKLLRNIRHGTGMSVASSLDEPLSLKNDYVPKRKQPIARKTAHPWGENEYPNYPTPESVPFSSPSSEYGLNDLNDFSLEFSPLDIPPIDLLEDFNLIDGNKTGEVAPPPLDEHNYTVSENIPTTDGVNGDDDVGVCLHVSKHRVSLEFCSNCSENSYHTWMH